MMPSKETLTRFKKLYEAEFNEKINDQEVYDRLSRLWMC